MSVLPVALDLITARRSIQPRINENRMAQNPLKAITLPYEETFIQPRNISGRLSYRRGPPFRPTKCIGIKIRNTPIKKLINPPSPHILLGTTPENTGAQRLIPIAILITAPIERTR